MVHTAVIEKQGGAQVPGQLPSSSSQDYWEEQTKLPHLHIKVNRDLDREVRSRVKVTSGEERNRRKR